MQPSPRLTVFIVQKNLPKQKGGADLQSEMHFQSLQKFQLDVCKERLLQIFKILFTLVTKNCPSINLVICLSPHRLLRN